jgi:S1-C subfamily serine protease
VLKVLDAKVGKNLHLFPDKDLALLNVEEAKDQPYAALWYSDVHEGSEIGIAGYPLPQLNVVNGQLHYGDLRYRVAKGTVTARYTSTINPVGNGPIPNAPILEVNFLFVPGNSGGPVFDAETGRVIGFVQGFNSAKILERIQKAEPQMALPGDVKSDYIHSVDAIYSLAIKMDLVRSDIETFGASL